MYQTRPSVGDSLQVVDGGREGRQRGPLAGARVVPIVLGGRDDLAGTRRRSGRRPGRSSRRASANAVLAETRERPATDPSRSPARSIGSDGAASSSSAAMAGACRTRAAPPGSPVGWRPWSPCRSGRSALRTPPARPATSRSLSTSCAVHEDVLHPAGRPGVARCDLDEVQPGPRMSQAGRRGARRRGRAPPRACRPGPCEAPQAATGGHAGVADIDRLRGGWRPDPPRRTRAFPRGLGAATLSVPHTGSPA